MYLTQVNTGEKPSYFLFGVDLRSPTDAVFYPESPVDAMDFRDYREEVVTCLFLAREAAAAAIKEAQGK